MNDTLLNIVLILIFVLIGGVFAAAEMALVSLRESQLKSLSHRGKRGETVARVAANPNRFLSAVQIGVTLMGFLSAAFGGATLADSLKPHLQNLGLPASVAGTVALVLITICISYVSIVIGELAAKRLALQRAETFALGLAPLVDKLASGARPVIWLLSKSTDLVVRALGGDPNANREVMSDEELRDLVSAHESLGEEERKIVDDVFEAGSRQLREVMLPRTEVDFVDGEMPAYKAVKFAAERPHSRYPVMNGSADDIVGFVHVRDLFDPAVASRSVRVGDLAREVLMLPDTAKLLPTLTEMRRRSTHIAIVLDEYGGTAGIVTLEDLVEELIGDIKDEYDEEAAETTRFISGDIEVDGLLNLDDFADATTIELPDGPYETVGGFLAARLGKVPSIGDEVSFDSHTLTVKEMDGRRVARVRLHRVRPAEGEQPPAETPAPAAD
ncbi:hemolysin family protein [Kribbella kalugense]|uniref:Putative hemolysin n=1 Tax=Kribbella kalugense TaxID=2512221 RepID=A0A4V3G6P0_9ACTN|nr:hemolysin family protein [Kribbella kalugense]TDW15354.1 putative hemolysin [Kribbella kalugense]